MKKEILFCFFTLVCTLQLNAQHTQYLFTGTIKGEKGVVKNAHIINLQTNQGTFSNQLGAYRIYASPGDSLQISSVQFDTKIKMVTQNDLKKKVINITLKEKSYELDEIVVKKTKLTGNLLSDMNRNKPLRREISAVTLGLPNAGRKKMSPIERKLYSLSSSSSGIPLDLIISMITGRYKRLKETKKLITENHDVETMMKKIKHFLLSEYNIKEEHHYRFLYYCRTDSSFTKDLVTDELALIKFLQQKSTAFNKIIEENSEKKE